MGDKGIEEQETFLHSRRAQPKKSKLRSFLDFLYDREHGKVLGRTGLSWLEITIFYIIFYSCLIAFWAICLAVFVATLNDKTPRYYGKGTIIGINPGMGYQPWLRSDPESTLIYINTSHPKSYQKYVDALNKYLKKYENTEHTRECTGDESNDQPDEPACRFSLEPFANAGCSKDQNYGYAEGKPCVVLTLNRLIAWRPVAYPKDSAPAELRGRYNYEEGDIAVACHGEHFVDAENIGELEYIPESGIARRYYPYRVMENYHQPITMVKFKNVQASTVVLVECKAFAYNIIHDETDRLGLIHFEVLVDS